jgi:hypothetical protein
MGQELFSPTKKLISTRVTKATAKSFLKIFNFERILKVYSGGLDYGSKVC